MLLLEYWKPIPGYDDLYHASYSGKIRRMAAHIYGTGVSNYSNGRAFLKEHILMPLGKTDKYFKVKLSLNGSTKQYTIHRLIATAFINNDDNKSDVNHKNGNKKDNSVSNLEWCTRSENHKHAIRTGLKNPPMMGRIGKNNPTSKRIVQKDMNGNAIKYYDSISIAAKEFGSRTVYLALTGQCKTAGGFKWEYANN